jgi:peroxiredoxin
LQGKEVYGDANRWAMKRKGRRNPNRRRLILLALMLSLAAGVGLSALAFQPNSTQVGQPGDKVLDITLKTVSGQPFTLSQLLQEGKPILVYFYATWCTVCDNDIRNLAAALDGFKDRVRIVLVGADITEGKSELRRFADRHNWEGWIIAEPNRDMLAALSIISQATKVGLSSKGELVFRQGYGIVGVDGWKFILSDLLKKG